MTARHIRTFTLPQTPEARAETQRRVIEILRDIIQAEAVAGGPLLGGAGTYLALRPRTPPQQESAP